MRRGATQHAAHGPRMGRCRPRRLKLGYRWRLQSLRVLQAGRLVASDIDGGAESFPRFLLPAGRNQPIPRNAGLSRSPVTPRSVAEIDSLTQVGTRNIRAPTAPRLAPVRPQARVWRSQATHCEHNALTRRFGRGREHAARKSRAAWTGCKCWVLRKTYFQQEAFSSASQAPIQIDDDSCSFSPKQSRPQYRARPNSRPPLSPGCYAPGSAPVDSAIHNPTQ